MWVILVKDWWNIASFHPYVDDTRGGRVKVLTRRLTKAHHAAKMPSALYVS